MSIDHDLRAQNPLNWLLHNAAMSADRIFQALLVQEYGKHAGNMRYTPAPYPREDLNVAKDQYVALSIAWSRYYRGWKDSWSL